MPESVQDRWKKAHEYIFFFVKDKKYYFDLDAIRTPHKEVSIKRAEYEQGRNALGLNPSSMGKKYQDNKRYMGMPARQVKLNEKGACPPDYFLVNTNCSENDGSDEHYATYPQKLLINPIKAGSPQNGIVLDPFMGSGTTAVVARQLGRNYIGIELNPNYIKLAENRLSQQILI
jgi:DNA modification methylase